MSGVLQSLLAAAGFKFSLGTASGNSSLPSGTATAQFQLTSSGDIQVTQTNNSVVDVGDWVSPKFNMGNYECRLTLSAGSFSTGTNNTWQNLGTTRIWTLSQVGSGSSSCTYTAEIRDAASLQVLASVVGGLSANVA